MYKRKIFNDPVYGFISFEYDLLYDLIEEPLFQRLRRIKQCGLSDYVYPGALHTRFHHALGATHLMQQAIQVLRQKGVSVSHDEAEAVCIAILLHDIGHAPFSHALEGIFTNQPHEAISLRIFHHLNEKYNGALDMAIRIFTGQYPNRFLHQLVSGQLDMDRMDYLNRDSYFTGVAEGIIGYDRIIKMLDVRDDRLVVEEKGIYSIEKFLIARKIMYWQVYLHKTVIAAEQMLRLFITEARASEAIRQWSGDSNPLIFQDQPDNRTFMDQLTTFDDYDIVGLLKKTVRHQHNPLLSYLATGLLERLGGHLFVERLEQGAALGGTELFDDVGHIGGVELADAVVRDAQFEAAVRVRLDDVAVLPGDRVLLEARLQLSDHPVGQDALGEPPEGPLQAHAHLVDPELVVRVGALDAQRDVVDAHHLAAIHVDDLLVEQIAVEQQVRLVSVVGDELVVSQHDPVEVDLADLVVADLKTGFAVAEQVVGDAAGVLSRRNCSFAHTPDARAVGPFQAKPGELG